MRPPSPTLAGRALALAVLLTAPPLATADDAHPALPAATRDVLAGGIDSLGRAHLARAGAAELAVISRVPADAPQAALDAKLAGEVRVRVRVQRDGLPDSAVAVSGDPRLRGSAAAAARWWIFAPPPRVTWTTVTVPVDGREPAEPLVPDVLAIARANERAGDWQGAIDAWVGALARVGRTPLLRNEWAIREHTVRLAQRMKGMPRISGEMAGTATAARGQQGHLVTGEDHERLAHEIDEALDVAPWWADAYEWRAASLANCGRGNDAMRSLELFRIGSRDSADRALAERGLAGLAAGDTVATAALLVREGRQFNTDADADH